MPELVRLYIRHVIMGFVLSAVFVALLIGLNVANLRHLMLASPGGWIAAIMLFVFNAIVFAGVQFGIAVMLMGQDDAPRGGHRQRAPVPVPIPVEVRIRRTR